MAHTFLSLPGWHVRGITRNAKSEAAQTLAAKGVEIFAADLDVVQTLYRAFEGAHVIFANTDFFAPLFTAIASPALTEGWSARVYAHDVEFKYGVNIAEAAALPSTLKTLDRFVYSSLSDATKWSNGKYTGVYHNNVKAKVEREIHARFPEVSRRMSTVHIGHYVTNWQIFPPLRPKKQSDGSFVLERTYAPDWKCPFLVAHRDTGSFVRALVDLPPGTNLRAFSEELTFPEFMKVWGNVHGVRASYKQVSVELQFEGVQEDLKGEMAETYPYEDEYGNTGGDPSILSAAEVSLNLCARG